MIMQQRGVAGFAENCHSFVCNSILRQMPCRRMQKKIYQANWFSLLGHYDVKQQRDEQTVLFAKHRLQSCNVLSQIHSRPHFISLTNAFCDSYSSSSPYSPPHPPPLLLPFSSYSTFSSTTTCRDKVFGRKSLFESQQ